MKRALLAVTILTLILIVSCASDKEEAEWKEFVFKEANFAITLPAPPSLDTMVSQTALGELVTPRYTLINEGHQYSISYSEMSDSLAVTSGIEKMFIGALQGAVRNMNGRLTSREFITLDRYPGQEAVLKINENQVTLKLRMYLVNMRFYQLMAVTETDSIPADINRFLNSFRLLEIPPLKEPALENWITYVSPDSAYKVEYPAPPNESESVMETVAGQPTLFVTSLTSKYREFSVMQTQYDQNWRNTNTPQQIFKNYRRGMLAEFENHENLQEQEIQFEGYPAYTIKFDLVANQGSFRGVAVLKDNSLYQLLALAPSHDPNPNYTQRFFDSFEFIQ